MYLCVRVDLDYVPWDTPDAEEFGHGEPAMLVRMLDVAKASGLKLHFFASTRVFSAFPAAADAVLNEGHDLDWLCKHPEDFDLRYAAARALLAVRGHRAVGFAVRGSWPESLQKMQMPSELQFISATPGPRPTGLKLFAVETRAERDTLRSGQNLRSWADATRAELRSAASLNHGVTLCLRPQVLARYDPRLSTVKELIDLGLAVGLRNRTLRELLATAKR